MGFGVHVNVNLTAIVARERERVRFCNVLLWKEKRELNTIPSPSLCFWVCGIAEKGFS